MNPISTVLKEQLEKFDERFPDLRGTFQYPFQDPIALRPNEVRDFFASSHRTLLEALLKEVESKYQDEHPTEGGMPVETYGYEAAHNAGLNDIASLLREALNEL